METNKPTNSEKKEYDKNLSEKIKESIIIRGIVVSLNAMSFPNFENLHEMLLPFNCGLDIENLKDGESLADLYVRNKKFLSGMLAHDYEIMTDEKANGTETNLVKSHTAKEKKFKLIDNLAYGSHVDLDKGTMTILYNSKVCDIDEKKTFECINLISALPTVGVSTLPIFKHCGHSYSVEEKLFDNINEILKLIVLTEFDFIIYTLYVSICGNLIMRWAVADKK